MPSQISNISNNSDRFLLQQMQEGDWIRAGANGKPTIVHGFLDKLLFCIEDIFTFGEASKRAKEAVATYLNKFDITPNAINQHSEVITKIDRIANEYMSTLAAVALHCRLVKKQESLAADYASISGTSAPVTSTPVPPKDSDCDDAAFEDFEDTPSFSEDSRSSIKTPGQDKIAPQQVQSPAVSTPQAKLDPLRVKQEEFLATFGNKAYHDYLRPMLPWAMEKLAKFLQSDASVPLLAKGITQLILLQMSKDASKDANADFKRAPNLAISFLKSELKTIKEEMQKIKNDPVLLKEFSTLTLSKLFKTNPELDTPELKPLLEMLLEKYSPEILEIVLEAALTCLNSEEGKKFLDSVVAKVKDSKNPIALEQVLDETFTFVIKDKLQTIEAVIHALASKMGNEDLNKELFKALKAPLLPLFFPKPENISQKQMDLIVSVLDNVVDFFTSLNHRAMECKDLKLKEFEKDELVLRKMLEDLYKKENLTAEEAKSLDSIDLIIERSLEEIIWNQLFPEPATPPENQTAVQKTAKELEAESLEKQTAEQVMALKKTAVKMMASYASEMAKNMLAPGTMNYLFQTLLENDIHVENPLERPSQPLETYDASNQKFNADMGRLAKALGTQVIGLGDGVLHNAAKLLLSKFEIPGAIIQQALNQLSNSGESITPFFLLSQLLYKIDPNQNVQGNPFTERLKNAPATFNLGTLLDSEQSVNNDQAALQARLDREILTTTNVFEKNTTLENKLEKALPFGTRNAAQEIIQKLYRYEKHPLFLKILFAYALKGIKNVKPAVV